MWRARVGHYLGGEPDHTDRLDDGEYEESGADVAGAPVDGEPGERDDTEREEIHGELNGLRERRRPSERCADSHPKALCSWASWASVPSRGPNSSRTYAPMAEIFWSLMR